MQSSKHPPLQIKHVDEELGLRFGAFIPRVRLLHAHSASMPPPILWAVYFTIAFGLTGDLGEHSAIRFSCIHHCRTLPLTTVATLERLVLHFERAVVCYERGL